MKPHGLSMSGMDSDSGSERHDDHRRRLFRSAHLAATPQNYGVARRDKNGNVSANRLSREGRTKRPFSLAGGASATLNNNNLPNNNNHEKSPPVPAKRTRSVTNAMAGQSHSNSTSPGSLDLKEKGSGSPNSSVSVSITNLMDEWAKTVKLTPFVLSFYRLVQKSQTLGPRRLTSKSSPNLGSSAAPCVITSVPLTTTTKNTRRSISPTSLVSIAERDSSLSGTWLLTFVLTLEKSPSPAFSAKGHSVKR